MTIKEAIKTLENGAWWESLDNDISDADMNPLQDALDIAIAALRAQQEAEKNEPLTLEELREMNGEPVWIENIHWNAYNNIKSGYRIVRRIREIAVEFEEYDKEFGPYAHLYLGNYGQMWLAYRHKPKEEDHA